MEKASRLLLAKALYYAARKPRSTIMACRDDVAAAGQFFLTDPVAGPLPLASARSGPSLM